MKYLIISAAIAIGVTTSASEAAAATKLKYMLVPIDQCDQQVKIDPETGQITFPCGFKVVPNKPGVQIPSFFKSVSSTASKGTKSLYKPITVTKYIGSTIHDNGDGTSTINHGGSATETINTKDASQVVKDYGDKGIKITPK